MASLVNLVSSGSLSGIWMGGLYAYVLKCFGQQGKHACEAETKKIPKISTSCLACCSATCFHSGASLLLFKEVSVDRNTATETQTLK